MRGRERVDWADRFSFLFLLYFLRLFLHLRLGFLSLSVSISVSLCFVGKCWLSNRPLLTQ